MALTEEERTLYNTRLTSAEGALHNLMIGEQAKVFVDQNGERVEFTQASAPRLRAYIAELRTLLGKQTISGPMQSWIL